MHFCIKQFPLSLCMYKFKKFNAFGSLLLYLPEPRLNTENINKCWCLYQPLFKILVHENSNG